MNLRPNYLPVSAKLSMLIFASFYRALACNACRTRRYLRLMSPPYGGGGIITTLECQKLPGCQKAVMRSFGS